MAGTRTTLDQWQALQAVVDQGSLAGAAEVLELNETALGYALHKLQKQLGVQLLQQDGQKVTLTDQGKILLDRSRHLLDEAQRLEALAQELDQGQETEIRLAVDSALPTPILLEALRRFQALELGTRISLRQLLSANVDEAIINNQADLAIGARIPAGFKGEQLAALEFVLVAHPRHPLHRIDRKLLPRDLQRFVQIIVSDGHGNPQTEVVGVSVEQQWRVATLGTAMALVKAGLGFSWLPKHMVQDEITADELKPLNMQAGGSYHNALYLIVGDPMHAGVATAKLTAIFQQVAGEFTE